MRAAQSVARPNAAARKTEGRIRGPSSLRVCSWIFRGCQTRIGGELRGFKKRQLFKREKSFGMHHWDNCLVQRGQSAIPIAFFALERQRERLKVRHGGHFFNAVDQQRGAGATQEKNERRGLRLQAEMNRGIYDVKSAITAADAVANFAQMTFRKIARHAFDVVNAAYFLYRGRRDRKSLSTDAKQNDLFGARRMRFGAGWKIHQRAPTGVARVKTRTRFSIAE